MSSFLYQSTPIQPAQVAFINYGQPAGDFILSWPFEFTENPNVVAPRMVFNLTEPTAVTLPDARDAAPGQSFIIANVGTPMLTIYTNAGGTSWSINNNISYDYLLVDNTTPDGLWRQTVFGAGSSDANAQALAGNGLVALPNPNISLPDQLNTNLIYTPMMNEPQVVDFNNRAFAFVALPGSSTQTVNLDPDTVILSGFFCYLSNQNTFPFVVNPRITWPNGTINGQPSMLVNPGEAFGIVADGNGNWYTLDSPATDPITLLSIERFSLSTITGNFNMPSELIPADVVVFIDDLPSDATMYIPKVKTQWIFQGRFTGSGGILSVQLTNGSGGGVGQIFQLTGQIGSTFETLTVIADPDGESLIQVPDYTVTSEPSNAIFNKLSPAQVNNQMIVSYGSVNTAVAPPSAEGQVLTIPDITLPVAWGGVATLARLTISYADAEPAGPTQTLPSTDGTAPVKIAVGSRIFIEGSVSWSAANTSSVEIVVNRIDPSALGPWTIYAGTTGANSANELYTATFSFVDDTVAQGSSYSYELVLTGTDVSLNSTSIPGVYNGRSLITTSEVYAAGN